MPANVLCSWKAVKHLRSRRNDSRRCQGSPSGYLGLNHPGEGGWGTMAGRQWGMGLELCPATLWL